MRIFSSLFALCALLPAAVHAQGYRTQADYAFLLDVETNTVLFEKEANAEMLPASMTKLMTLYMLFDALKRGDILLEDTFPVSEKAWRKGGSKMFVKEGSRVKVEDLIRGIVVHSGNDACIVVAEALSGSEEAFAEDMNFMAKKIGLHDTYLKNATGWPEEGHVMSARDLGMLAYHLIENFPEYYPYFAETTFRYSGIKQNNRNGLLYRNIGADGLKTGHTEASGYGLVSSAMQEGRRLIAVVNGLATSKARNTESERLLRHGFRDYRRTQLFGAGEVIEHIPLWMGASVRVPVIAEEAVTLLSSRRISQQKEARVEVHYEGPIAAPVEKGQRLGELVIFKGEGEQQRIPLLAKESVERAGLLGRLGTLWRYYILGRL